jgi:8-oxo-dGTP pyrophosphatase MutT (NUDIX family)
LAPLRVRPARYFDTVFSNDSTGISLYSPGEREPSFDGRQLCFPEDTIWSCDDPRHGRAGDALGASIVAVTSDRRVVLVRQSSHSKLSPGLLAPSGSGGGDWSDRAAPGGLRGLATQIALRELEEECGLGRTDIVAVKVLGYGRFLQRGGKPEFFALARLGCAAHRIKVAGSERLLVEGHEFVGLPSDAPSAGAALRLAAAELGRDRSAELSSSLWWNLELILEAEPAVLDPMFDGL